MTSAIEDILNQLSTKHDHCSNPYWFFIVNSTGIPILSIIHGVEVSSLGISGLLTNLYHACSNEIFQPLAVSTADTYIAYMKMKGALCVLTVGRTMVEPYGHIYAVQLMQQLWLSMTCTLSERTLLDTLAQPNNRQLRGRLQAMRGKLEKLIQSCTQDTRAEIGWTTHMSSSSSCTSNITHELDQLVSNLPIQWALLVHSDGGLVAASTGCYQSLQTCLPFLIQESQSISLSTHIYEETISDRLVRPRELEFTAYTRYHLTEQETTNTDQLFMCFCSTIQCINSPHDEVYGSSNTVQNLRCTVGNPNTTSNNRLLLISTNPEIISFADDIANKSSSFTMPALLCDIVSRCDLECRNMFDKQGLTAHCCQPHDNSVLEYSHAKPESHILNDKYGHSRAHFVETDNQSLYQFLDTLAYWYMIEMKRSWTRPLATKLPLGYSGHIMNQSFDLKPTWKAAMVQLKIFDSDDGSHISNNKTSKSTNVQWYHLTGSKKSVANSESLAITLRSVLRSINPSTKQTETNTRMSSAVYEGDEGIATCASRFVSLLPFYSSNIEKVTNKKIWASAIQLSVAYIIENSPDLPHTMTDRASVHSTSLLHSVERVLDNACSFLCESLTNSNVDNKDTRSTGALLWLRQNIMPLL